MKGHLDQSRSGVSIPRSEPVTGSPIELGEGAPELRTPLEKDGNCYEQDHSRTIMASSMSFLAPSFFMPAFF
jgi:hypothetical protein